MPKSPLINAFQFNNAQFNALTEPATPAKNLSGIIRDPVHFPFRKVEMKRRQVSDGLYESSWQDITKYVEKYGTLNTSLDDERLNQFVHSGINLTLKNDYGEFNSEVEGRSLFYGYLSRYRSLVRITAGYTDGAGTQYPTDAVQGIFIIDGEIGADPELNTIRLGCKSIVSPLQDTRADEIDGITGSITASQIIEKIRDATDGSSNFLFRNFITSTAWNIQTTTTVITGLGTTTALDGFSVWELMIKLAEVERFVVHATKSGGIVFADRTPNSLNPTLRLYGAGFRKPNIIKINSYGEAVNKLFTHFRYKYLDDDTTTSYISGGTQTTVSPTSDEWVYGRRTYEFENTFFSDTGTAQNVAAKMNSEFGNLRNEMEVQCLFLPQVELLDRITVNYRQESINSIHVWDERNWAAATDTVADVEPVFYWASETSGVIDFTEKHFKIIGRRTNLDMFTTTLKLREVEN